jgi:hypothetical protein
MSSKKIIDETIDEIHGRSQVSTTPNNEICQMA